jgi:hypothetical protein
MSVSRRVGLFAALLLVACEKKPPPPTPSSGMPPLEEANRPPAPTANRPEHPPMGGSAALPAGHPALPPGHPPMGQAGGDIDPKATTPGDIPFDPKSMVSGMLRLDDKVKSKVAEGDVLFLVARAVDAGGGPGPILAVKRLTAGKWPAQFQLDGRDAMMVGTKLSGKIIISARIDKDGDAITKNPGDVTGTTRAIDVPADKVVLTLDTVLQ